MYSLISKTFLPLIAFATLGMAGLDRRASGASALHAGLNYTDPVAVHDLFTKRILEQSPRYGNFPKAARNRNGIGKVGVVGAGAAGLYAGLLLQSLGVDYEILEASNDRVGGRIWTYRFTENAKPGTPGYYDYYDVGAMRFPGMAWMDRVIGSQNNSMVSYINANAPEENHIKMVPYIFTANNTFLRYNDRIIKTPSNLTGDPFEVSILHGGNIEADFAAQSPGTVLNGLFELFTDALNQDFNAGFDFLMLYDTISVRQYFMNLGYTTQEVDWLETTNDATNHYDLSLSQTILEQWIFTAAPLSSWTTIDGGLDRLITGMVKVLKGNPIKMGNRVTEIKYTNSQDPSQGLTVVTNTSAQHRYAHVINAAPLGPIQAMDMSDLDLEYPKKMAIRTLTYDPAMKIGIKFAYRWWENSTYGFKGGQSYSDLPLRRCVYPSYGVDIAGAPGTMIASYTWGQDASRLGSYLFTEAGRQALLELTLHDLAAMNNVSYEFVKSLYIGLHAWSWYNSELSIAAFARFGPGQYVTTLPALLEPAATGRLHFAGEALSAGHGWIIGAYNSAYRAVAEVLAVQGRDDLLDLLISKWGTIDEVDMGWYYSTLD